MFIFLQDCGQLAFSFAGSGRGECAANYDNLANAHGRPSRCSGGRDESGYGSVRCGGG
jgi:hypothetical protein